ncbi:MAG TPA: diguanylate cyclase [Candidatus Hydrogenedentes bacterium]|nr:diguanylate cyclase [Candidatus Hydrogenedentota bacterium]HPG67710.1 diguanylate cyclase [Candidatus Hydrogenedentota bacterium]
MADEAHSADPLTGLDTYDAFMARLEKAMAKAGKAHGSVSMGLVDIDRFRQLNQQHGTEAGDRVLQAVAACLVRHFSEPKRVYRYGGDAFAILLDGQEKEEAFLLLEAVRADFDEHRLIEGAEDSVPAGVTITVGIAAFPDDGGTAQEVARKANEAVYRAKVGGRNKVCLAREEKMVPKTSHFTQGQLHGLSRIAKREGVGEAVLLREAVDDLLRKYNA